MKKVIVAGAVSVVGIYLGEGGGPDSHDSGWPEASTGGTGGNGGTGGTGGTGGSITDGGGDADASGPLTCGTASCSPATLASKMLPACCPAETTNACGLDLSTV